jgi:hypothetical protein
MLCISVAQERMREGDFTSDKGDEPCHLQNVDGMHVGLLLVVLCSGNGGYASERSMSQKVDVGDLIVRTKCDLVVANM